MKVLEHRIPPPIVTAIFAVIMWQVSTIGYTFDLNALLRDVIIVLLVVLGACFSLGGMLTFKKAETTVNPLKPDSASSLVTSGIFGLSRNPMYVGMALFLLAWGTYLCSVFAFFCVPVFVYYIDRFQIKPEERALQGIFGDEFERYTSSVRRWL